MKIATPIFALVLATAPLRPSGSARADEPKAPVVRAPIAVLTGADSRVARAAYHRVTSEADWKKTWAAHLGTAADTMGLKVDFSRCLVVAVFCGESFNSRGYRVESTIEEDDVIVVRIDSLSYQTGGMSEDGGAERVKPYAFIVLPKSEKTIVVQDNVQQTIGQPPVWKEIARLIAVKQD